MSTNHTARSVADHAGPSPRMASTGQTHSTSDMSRLSVLAVAAVHPIVMRGAHARIIGGEEQDLRGDADGIHARPEALLREDLGFLFRRVPELHLPRRADGARHHAVDPDV